MRRGLLKLLKQTIGLLISLAVLSVIVFYMARLTPGDPLVSYLGERAEKLSSEERRWAEEKLGLDQPIYKQYVCWVTRASKGDLGISYKYKRPVTEVISERIGNTLILGGIGFILIFTLALLLGVLCAWHEERWLDKFICQIGTITSCLPEFWVSLLLILIFSVKLKLFPSSGAYSVGQEDQIGDRIWHLVLPMCVVVTSHLWYYAYMIRNKLLEEIRRDYVLLARAKGMRRHKVLFKHCLRNIMPTYMSTMAISVSHILGGTYMVEMVFSYPGIGTLAYESAKYKDYHLLMLLSLLTGAIVIVSNGIAQLISEAIDPRIKEKEEVEVLIDDRSL